MFEPMVPNDVSLESSAQATGTFSYRLPAASRVVVPPPHMHQLEDRIRLNGKVRPQDDFDISFLNGIDLDGFLDEKILHGVSWNYEMRRDLTQILPFLWLGPLAAARETQRLQEAGITMLLSVQQRTSTSLSKMSRGPAMAADMLGIAKAVIEIRDHAELISAFPRAAALINQHLQDFYAARREMPNVLVFCESGNHRSAAVVAAYLLQMFEGTDLISALQIVSVRRFSANVEEEMRQYLLSYDGILRAQRDARAAQPNLVVNGVWNGVQTGRNSPGILRKRGRSNDEDSSMDIDDDLERFLGRDSAPFADEK
jgi:serine/threonine/tyrosine-interacting protein